MSISYPVDVQNTRWSIVRISTQEIIKTNQKWPRADGSEIVGLSADIVPLLIVNEAQPVYDPDTHKLERAAGVIDIPNNTHTFGWNVVALSQGELNDKTELAAIKAAYTALKNGTGTQLERLVRVEQVLSRVLKDQYAP